MASVPTQLARAKVNLTLHVGRVIRDADRFHGYHPLDSLVVFADVGDRLDIRPSDRPGLTLTGPFGDGLPPGEDNLVLKALRAAERVAGAGDFHVVLDKRLPVASGVGGGSADAAAILRAVMGDHPDLMDTALSLGADVPACVMSQTLRMTGIGEDLTPLPGLGSVPAILVNPGVAVATGEVFRRFDSQDPRATPRPQSSEGTLIDRACDGRNDLEKPAIAMASVIADVIEAVATQPGCEVARMSGSGATVFGIFATDHAAALAASRLSDTGWWAVACRLGDTDSPDTA